MTGDRGPTPLHRFVTGCLTLLAAALAINIAVHLIEAVWVALLALAAVAVLVGALLARWRDRHRGW